MGYPANDPRQYDDLAGEWWRPDGGFAMLHWLAAARAEVLPPPARPGAVLVDVACGGGLLAPHVARAGYRHVGIDIGVQAPRVAAAHGVLAVRGDATRLPLSSGCADVVVAGEVLEHVADVAAVVAEACRVLRPGGTVVLDTIAATRVGRLVAVTLGERVPGGAPHGIHDPALFVDRGRLVALFAAQGVRLTLRGLRPSVPGYLRWLLGRGRPGSRRAAGVRLVPTRSTAALFQAVGTMDRGEPA